MKQLQEVQSAELQMKEVLSWMANLAGDEQLKEAITAQLDDTQSQFDHVDRMLKQHGADPDQHQDQSMSALISESKQWVQMLEDATLRDAGLIASIQMIMHYKIATYGTLACWAEHLGLEEDMEVFRTALDRNKAFNEDLSALAKREINPDALK